MTNEQLKLLLNQIADNISNLASQVEPLIFDGLREKEYVWIGEGEEPYMVVGMKGWERVEKQNSRFQAVLDIESFADDLRNQADELVKKE